MSDVTTFPKPYRDRIEVISGTNKETGRPIYLFELIDGDGRCIIEDCDSEIRARQAAKEMRMDGYQVVWDDE